VFVSNREVGYRKVLYDASISDVIDVGDLDLRLQLKLEISSNFDIT